MREVLASNDVRTLIANQLGVDVKRVTDEAHFTDDLGADWLDRLDLMIVIEDRFADVVITDEDVDQVEVVGDLIRHIESVEIRKLWPRLSSRAVEPAEQAGTLRAVRHAHAAGDVCWGAAFFTRGPFERD
jgi:acyl carrier protein